MASVVLPDSDLDWARSRVEAGEASSVEAFFSDLARRHREEAEESAWLQREIDKGLASGVDPRPAEQIFRDVFRSRFGVDG